MVSFYGALALLACGSLDGQSLSCREKYKNVRLEKKGFLIQYFSPAHTKRRKTDYYCKFSSFAKSQSEY